MQWLLVILFSLVPSAAFAHTKWFAEGSLDPFVTSEPTTLYLLMWGGIAAVIVACGIYLERRGKLQLAFLQPQGNHAFFRAASVFSMVTGAFLVIAGAYGYLFSPVIVDVPAWMLYAEVVIGFAFLFGIAARVAGLSLFILWVLGMCMAGTLAMFEAAWVAGAALFITIMGNDYFSLVSIRFIGKYVQHLKPYALPLLRMGAGTTLLTLGFSEKLLHPEFGIHFLEGHAWNFMSLLGIPYSDYLFTLSAGSVEALFGVVFILGFVTRLNALVVATFFSIPLFILGPIELTGHLPHFAAIIMLLLFGAGPHWKVRQP